MSSGTKSYRYPIELAKGFGKEQLFKRLLKKAKVTELTRSKIESGDAFGITHFNNPDFLFLNVARLERLHPNDAIIVFDNNSEQANKSKVVSELRTHRNITLLLSQEDYSEKWCCHIIALQYMLNYSVNYFEHLTLLDQDCILARNISDLKTKFNSDIMLIGVRDYVLKTQMFGMAIHKYFRSWPAFVHASFMMVQPRIILKLFGKQSLMNGYTFEPYHGISKKLQGKILYLDTEMHPTIPMLTRYYLEGETYAWHSWYSSRVLEMNPNAVINYLPVRFINDSVEQSYKFMQQLN